MTTLEECSHFELSFHVIMSSMQQKIQFSHFFSDKIAKINWKL